MVNFNKILTLISVSTLCAFVYGKPLEKRYTGDCKDVDELFNRHNVQLDGCYVNENEEILQISLKGETIDQEIINGIGKYDTLQYLTLNDVKNFPKNINLETLNIIGLIIVTDNDKPASVIPKGVLKTAKKINEMHIYNEKISQKNINEISTLTNIKTLGLYGCSYERNIDFSNLKKTKTLSSLYIQYDGGERYSEKNIGFPKSLCKIASLNDINIGFGAMTTIPNCIGNLKNLQILNLGHNSLKSLPNEIGKLTNLKKLDLTYNAIEKVPSTIENLTKLEYLNLGSNKIDSIPSAITSLENLKSLFLERNAITEIPESIVNLKNLETLYLNDNNITTVPEVLAELEKLKPNGIYLDGNMITSVPESLKDIHLERQRKPDQGN